MNLMTKIIKLNNNHKIIQIIIVKMITKKISNKKNSFIKIKII